MTVRRLATITVFAALFLVAAIAANTLASTRSPAIAAAAPLRPAPQSTAAETASPAGATDTTVASTAADSDQPEHGGASPTDATGGAEDPEVSEDSEDPEDVDADADQRGDAPNGEADTGDQSDEAVPEPVATPGADLAAAPSVDDVIDVEPPALVEIPADLIATPTPDSPTVVPLPMLTNIASGPRDGSAVYLTFDDGPDPVYTNQILDVLAAYGAKATFFVIGNSADAYPAVMQRIVAEGHAIANHTYYHEALPRESDEHVVQTLSATSGAIARTTGLSTACFRPPYGALDQRTFDIVAGQGYAVHMWEVDSEDWKSGDSYSIASRVLSNVSPGDRVLFHDGPSNRASTVAALQSVLDVLSTRGVQFHALSC